MSHGLPANFLNLPVELVEKVARQLDDESLASFAAVHPNFRDTCKHLMSVTSVRSLHVHRSLNRLVAANVSIIRTLNLSDCWSDSDSMKVLIQRCRSIQELNVVNSSLTPQHLLDAIGPLELLKKLSATIIDAEEDARAGVYSSIESLYLEFGPHHADARFAIILLKACPSTKDLRFSVIGNAGSPFPPNLREWVDMEDPLTKYETLVIFGCKQWKRSKVYTLLFGQIDPLYSYALQYSGRDGIFYYKRDLVTRRGRRAFRNRKLVYDLYKHTSLNLPSAGRSHGFSDVKNDGQTIGLCLEVHSDVTCPEMPALTGLQNLRELDLSRCHALFSAETWRSFVKLSPKVEELALPSCSLFGSRKASRVEEDILKALAKLQLRRLHLETPEDDCTRCTAEIDGALMAFLSDFKNLEEFSLHRARVSEGFLDYLEQPLSMRTVKLNVDALGDDLQLVSFLSLCRNLRNLKLEAFDLPLSSVPFWEALGKANLEQLCLSTAFLSVIDPPVMRLSLFWLFKTLQVFHLHARDAPNSGTESLIAEEARAANLVRGWEPVTVIVNQQSIADERNSRSPRLAGRSLCSMESFIAAPKPVGWETDS